MSLATRNLEPIVVPFCTVDTLSALLTRTMMHSAIPVGQNPINVLGLMVTEDCITHRCYFSDINGFGKPRGGWCKRVLFHPPEDVSSLGKVADAR